MLTLQAKESTTHVSFLEQKWTVKSEQPSSCRIHLKLQVSFAMHGTTVEHISGLGHSLATVPVSQPFMCNFFHCPLAYLGRQQNSLTCLLQRVLGLCVNISTITCMWHMQKPCRSALQFACLGGGHVITTIMNGSRGGRGKVSLDYGTVQQWVCKVIHVRPELCRIFWKATSSGPQNMMVCRKSRRV